MANSGMHEVEVQAAVGTTVGVFRQGATVNTDDEIDFFQQDVVEVPVYDTGSIVVGDGLQIDADDTIEILVTAVAANGTSITMQGMSDSAFVLVRGTRLIVVSRRPPCLITHI